MNLLAWLTKLAGFGSGNSLVDLLTQAGNKVPDLKPQADDWIAKLRGAVDPANLLNVSQAIPGEIANILKLNIESKDHPSDSI
jgi:hypothetical protein